MNWAYDEPANKEATINRHVVVTKEKIIRSYFPVWSKKMAELGKLHDQITPDNCFDDWATSNWAYPTDEEPGIHLEPILNMTRKEIEDAK